MNRDQKAFWTDHVGPVWVARQAQMDHLLGPVLDGVLDRAVLSPGDAVLDIGCGAGTSSRRAAQLVGKEGQVLGADISDTLLGVAWAEAKDTPQLDYALADAASHSFDAALFDHLISRFGVMFFEDSAAAFRNMRKALKPCAKVTFATWGQIPENPYFTYAAQAASAVLGPVPKADPDAPGPFAFRDTEMVLGLLTDTGFEDPAVEVVSLTLPAPGGLQELADLCCAIGAAQSALTHHEATPEQTEALQMALVEVFAPFASDEGVHIPAEINFFTARAED